MPVRITDNMYDVFHAYLVQDAEYDGRIELPCLRTSNKIPNRVITFSKAMERKTSDYDCWIVFYEHDYKFERLWNNPTKYIDKLKKYNGIISPDFSLYRNMPLVLQEYNTYRGRALASWLQKNGVEIIPNIRWGDNRTFEFCFDGIEKNAVVSVGTHGCIKHSVDKAYFKTGLAELVKRLKPTTIIVYGAAPNDIFAEYINSGIKIIQFESEFSKSRKQVTA